MTVLPLAGLLVLPALAGAQQPAVRVFNSSPFALLVDGEKAYGSPVIARTNSVVCVTVPIGYQGEGDRLVFKGWSNGSQEECVTFAKAGDYSVLYITEVLIQVKSRLREYRQSLWVTRGTPVVLTVPELVEERPGARWRFEEWDGGETPFVTKNTIVPLRAMAIEAKYKREYYVVVEGPSGVSVAGTGWYPEAQSVALRAMPEVQSSDGKERLRFAQWTDAGGALLSVPSAQNPTTTIRVDDAYVIRADYRQEFLVVVETPQGVFKRSWVPKGGEFAVEVPPVIEIAPDRERLTFKGWAAGELTSAKGLVVIDRPLDLKALYTREFMVKVESPYGGSGAGWYPEGAKAAIRVPKNPGGVLFYQKTFDTFYGYSSLAPELQVEVKGPVTISAAYKTSLNLKMLSVMLGLLAVASIVYFLSQERIRTYLGKYLRAQTSGRPPR
ncbi:MAG: hypothetical protein HYY31_04670 [Chloroflexi bacterium]|nr:hypothetical protein [Chloroflexota bacterium]